MSDTAAAKEARGWLDKLQGEDRIRAVTMLMEVPIVTRQLTAMSSEAWRDSIADLVIDASKKSPAVAGQLRAIAGFEHPVQRLVVRELLDECVVRLGELEKKRQDTGVLLTIA